MYVRLIQIACIYIVTKRVENSYSPRGLVQGKGYSPPRISTRLGRALSSIPVTVLVVSYVVLQIKLNIAKHYKI